MKEEDVKVKAKDIILELLLNDSYISQSKKGNYYLSVDIENTLNDIYDLEYRLKRDNYKYKKTLNKKKNKMVFDILIRY